MCIYFEEKNDMLKNVMLAVVAATVVGMLVSLVPDIKRYARIRAM